MKAARKHSKTARTARRANPTPDQQVVRTPTIRHGIELAQFDELMAKLAKARSIVSAVVATDLGTVREVHGALWAAQEFLHDCCSIVDNLPELASAEVAE